MPQIIVAADGGDSFGEGAVTLRERVNVEDFESRHFATQLVERIGWAVEDADVAEQPRPGPDTTDRRRPDVADRRRPEMTDRRHPHVPERVTKPERVTAQSPA